MMIGRGNRSTRRKPAPVPLWPPQNPHAWPDENPGRRGRKPVTNRVTYDKAHVWVLLAINSRDCCQIISMQVTTVTNQIFLLHYYSWSSCCLVSVL
jgi:hypothetical protein